MTKKRGWKYHNVQIAGVSTLLCLESKMYWAIKDYMNFRKVGGRYTPFSSSSFKSWHYQRSIPIEVIDKLKVGDSILSGNYNRFTSWLIMYLSNSITSHAMIYAGNGKIVHATTSGPKHENLSNYFGWGMVFLPVAVVSNNLQSMEEFEKWIAMQERKQGYNYKRVVS